MKPTLIFGREPAAWLALVAIIIKLVCAFGLNLSTDQQAWVNAAAAALVGLIVAITVHDGIGAAVVGLVQAGLALAVGLGLDWSADRQAVVLSLASAIVAMWTRTQVTAKVAAPGMRIVSG
jgi:hypothetical protein